MDIRIGGAPPVGSPADPLAASEGAVEARLLAVRPPRKRSVRAPGTPDRRERGAEDRDPFNGRVLVLLIPDGSRLPPGLASGEYRVFLRFARR